MKSTIVPAQITTVEDKIAGNLTLSQLLLLAAPIFGGSILYIVFPPSLHFAIYKLVLVVGFAFTCGLMAIRVNGKILLLWAVVIVRYNLRPRYHVLDKNHTHLRVTDDFESDETETEKLGLERTVVPSISQLSTADIVRLEQLIENPRANVLFKPGKKGGMNVSFTEVE